MYRRFETLHKMLIARRLSRRELLLVSYCFIITWPSISSGAEYRITTTWDNQTIDHPNSPIVITLDRNDADTFKITVDGPYFADPPGPVGSVGEPFYGLWDYEVAEVFFLNDENQYVEIELCPQGQHIILFLNGYRNTIRHSLLMDVQANRTDNTWQGVAIVPVDYLPPNVTRMNAYAIHGTDPNRVYESLYPVPTGSVQPDFHYLEAFQPFDRSMILTQDPGSRSSVWSDALNGLRSFTIAHTWNGSQLAPGDQVNLQVRNEANTNLILTVDAPFYNDDPSTAAGPNPSLFNYEVVHFFLLNSNGEYLEIELGPHGGYLVAFQPFWNGETNQDQYPIRYSADRQMNNRWNGTAIIPWTYLPPQVTKCNAGSKHGSTADNRYHNSLYFPQPTVANVNNTPWTHYDPQIANFKAIDLSIIYPNNDQVGYSQIWQQFIDLSSTIPSNLTNQSTTVSTSSASTPKNANNSAPVSKVKTASSIMTTLFLICIEKLLLIS